MTYISKDSSLRQDRYIYTGQELCALFMKKDFGWLYSVFAFLFVISMTCVSVCLVIEYRFFRQQVQELIRLKSHYQTCLQILKRQNQQELHAVSHESDEKKSHPHRCSFLVLNRQSEHIKKEAIAFGQKKNLERSLKKLYEQHEPIGTSVKHKKAQKKSPVAHKPYSKQAYAAKKNARVAYTPALYKNTKSKGVNQLRQERFFAWPLDDTTCKFWITSRFGPRKNPNGKIGFHAGCDLAAKRGTHVKAAASGKVIEAYYHKGYGNMVLIAHACHTKTRYAHLDTIRVKSGDLVTKGTLIGTVGNTGHVRPRKGGDGSHLHFEVFLRDVPIDPLLLLSAKKGKHV